MAVDGQVADPLHVELSSTVIVYCVAQPDQYSNIGSLLSTLEPWVMTSAPGETEYRTPFIRRNEASSRLHWVVDLNG
jgi:hypothetical protein